MVGPLNQTRFFEGGWWGGRRGGLEFQVGIEDREQTLAAAAGLRLLNQPRFCRNFCKFGRTTTGALQ